MSILSAVLNGYAKGRGNAHTKEKELLEAADKVRQKSSNERLKTRFDKAIKKYDRFQEENEYAQMNDVSSPEAQWQLSGSKNAGISLKDFSESDRTGKKMHGLHTLGKRPDLEYLNATNYRAPQKSFLTTLALGGGEEYTGESMTQAESGKYDVSSVRTGAKDLAKEQMDKLKKDRLNRLVTGNKLDVQKKQDYLLTNYKDSEMFPELVDAPEGILKRIAFDVANKTISLNREGLQVDIFQETLNSLKRHLEFSKEDGATPTDVPSVDLADTSIPQAERIAAKEAEDLANKQADALAKKKAEEKRKIETTAPSKITNQDTTLAGNVLSATSHLVKGKKISFMDELSEEDKNGIETDVAGNVNVIINQTRMSQTNAYDLATALAKSGLVHEGDNVVTDLFTNEFSYQSPTLQWRDVYDTYNELKKNNPNLTYDTVVRSITNKNKK